MWAPLSVTASPSARSPPARNAANACSDDGLGAGAAFGRGLFAVEDVQRAHVEDLDWRTGVPGKQ